MPSFLVHKTFKYFHCIETEQHMHIHLPRTNFSFKKCPDHTKQAVGGYFMCLFHLFYIFLKRSLAFVVALQNVASFNQKF